VQDYSGIVRAKRQLTHDIVSLRLELVEPKEMTFRAGQIIRLTTEPYGDKPSVTRTYSIGSLPSDKGFIELNIRRVPGGVATTWIFDHVHEGQTVRFQGPYGKFVLSATSAPTVMIAGGSGLGPIRAFAMEMREKCTNRVTRCFFGARTQKDLYYMDDFAALEKELPDFRFIPALSDEPVESGWKGERGLITESVGRAFGPMSGWEAYLCGPPGMIDACLKVLAAKGVEEKDIFYDKFV
jgi:Na+-transporting NADH:ubiquinone oxidoreductase subunit F